MVDLDIYAISFIILVTRVSLIGYLIINYFLGNDYAVLVGLIMQHWYS